MLLMQGSNTLSGQHPQAKENVSPACTRNEKTLNLQTYKLHALGDYTETIRQYGTTDSYSTQPVSHFLNWKLVCLWFDCIDFCRVSSNIVLASQDLHGWAKSCTSNSWPKLNGAKHASTKSVPTFPYLTSCTKSFQQHLKSITLLQVIKLPRGPQGF